MTQGTAATAIDASARFAMRTDTGRVRAHNEDTCAADVAAGLYVVCDGMGGAAAGEIASQLAARVFLEQARQLGLHTTSAWRLEQAARAANAAVFDASQRSSHLQGMGTTLVALELDPASDSVWVVHVGDSRCYRLRDGTLQPLTHDHSYVDEQVRLGLMTSQEAQLSPLRHVITRAVGSQADVEATVVTHATQPGDLYLLCTDGVTGELDDAAIASVLQSSDALDTIAQALVDQANDHGGADNLTVMLVRL